jgi:lysophospholipase L1-like esterase
VDQHKDELAKLETTMHRPIVFAQVLALLLVAGPFLLTFCHADDAAPAPTNPPQIPLCMIGDSITWAGDGDYWRKHLLDMLPRLAFVGTHSAVLGYSHAGEGGNGTARILARMDDIPDCPYYSLMIGTNDNSVKDANLVQERSQQTAERIQQIVEALLAKPSVKLVFLSSIAPCFTDNPLRDQTNSATNVILREKMQTVFAGKNVVWVEYEHPIRAIEGWEPLIKLHPTKDGYQILARILSDAIIEALGIEEPLAVPEIADGCGVRVENLWDAETGQTSVPIIAGWYMLSFDLKAVPGEKATITVRSVDRDTEKHLNQVFEVKPEQAGQRVQLDFMTGYEGYQYTRSKLEIAVEACEIERVLLEKKRPSAKASEYGVGSYMDTSQTPAPGELVEWSGE